jgi:hypothetical protein
LELPKLLIGADGAESFLADAPRYAAGAVAHVQSVGITVGAAGFLGMLARPATMVAAGMDVVRGQQQLLVLDDRGSRSGGVRSVVGHRTRPIGAKLASCASKTARHRA